MILEDALWSAVAALGFAVLFNVPPRALLACALTGAVGHAIRTFLMQNVGVSIELATIVGATWVGFMGVWFARYLHAPSLIFSVSGAIPLVPGLFAYSTMLGLLELVTNPDSTQGLLLETARNGIKTGLILGAIGLGIIMPKLLFSRVKPVV